MTKKGRRYTAGSPDNIGEHTANAAFCLFRAIYADAASVHDDWPPNPCSALHGQWFKPPEPRTAIPRKRLPEWYARTAAIANPVRRDYLRFALFTGLRLENAAVLRGSDADLARRTLHIRVPKGGVKRACVLPLSDYLITLVQRRRDEDGLPPLPCRLTTSACSP